MKKISRYSRILFILTFLLLLGSLAWALGLRFAHGRGWAVWTGFTGKSLWDWLDLLIVPAVLAVAAYWFNRSERQRDQRLADERNREAILQGYLDKMTELLLEKRLLDFRDYRLEPEVSVAQARTVTALRALDERRRNILLQFLRDAGLADFILVGASLRQTDLRRTSLSKFNLSGAFFIEANLREAWLNGANLSKAVLSRANLEGARLLGATLLGADLSQADLQGANLAETDLSRAMLLGANLAGADLSQARLSEAAVTAEQLKSVRSLAGTILPDEVHIIQES